MTESLNCSRVELEEVRIAGQRFCDRPHPERLKAWLRAVDQLIENVASPVLAKELRLRCEIARSFTQGYPQPQEAVFGDVRSVEAYVSELIQYYSLQPSNVPNHLLSCCKAVLFCEKRQHGLGTGLQPDDVARTARLDAEDVRRCLAFLEEQGFVRAAPFGQPGEFVVNEREELRYYVDEHLGRAATVTPIHNEYIMGDKYEQNISNSNVGAAAVGPGAQATNTAYAASDAASWRESVDAAMAALPRDKDALDELGEGVYEAFSQLLRMVRQIEIDQSSAAQVQAQLKDAVDDLWADAAIKKIPGSTAHTLETLKSLKGPAELITKALVGAGAP